MYLFIFKQDIMYNYIYQLHFSTDTDINEMEMNISILISGLSESAPLIQKQGWIYVYLKRIPGQILGYPYLIRSIAIPISPSFLGRKIPQSNYPRESKGFFISTTCRNAHLKQLLLFLISYLSPFVFLFKQISTNSMRKRSFATSSTNDPRKTYSGI